MFFFERMGIDSSAEGRKIPHSGFNRLTRFYTGSMYSFSVKEMTNAIALGLHSFTWVKKNLLCHILFI